MKLRRTLHRTQIKNQSCQMLLFSQPYYFFNTFSSKGQRYFTTFNYQSWLDQKDKKKKARVKKGLPKKRLHGVGLEAKTSKLEKMTIRTWKIGNWKNGKIGKDALWKRCPVEMISTTKICGKAKRDTCKKRRTSCLAHHDA